MTRVVKLSFSRTREVRPDTMSGGLEIAIHANCSYKLIRALKLAVHCDLDIRWGNHQGRTGYNALAIMETFAWNCPNYAEKSKLSESA